MELSTVNMEAVTIQDCIDLYDKRGVLTVCEDGEIKDFRFEV